MNRTFQLLKINTNIQVLLTSLYFTKFMNHSLNFLSVLYQQNMYFQYPSWQMCCESSQSHRCLKYSVVFPYYSTKQLNVDLSKIWIKLLPEYFCLSLIYTQLLLGTSWKEYHIGFNFKYLIINFIQHIKMLFHMFSSYIKSIDQYEVLTWTLVVFHSLS